MPNKDRGERLKAGRRWYKRHRKERLASVRAYKRKQCEWYRNFKKTLKCDKCGETHPACLEFHHINGNKKKKILICKMANSGYSTASIKKEIAKCQVLCSNCHKKLHHPIIPPINKKN